LILPGVSALAGPVFDHEGRVAAVISVVGRQGAFDSSPGGVTANALRRMLDLVSIRLGYAA